MLKFMIHKNEDEYVLIIEYEDRAERLLVNNIGDLIQTMANTVLFNCEGKSRYFDHVHYANVEITWSK